MAGMSIRGYAADRKRRGLPGGTKWAVQKALEHGRIRRGPDGKIDPAQADADWEANTDPTSQAKAKPDKGAFPTFAEHRAIREAYAARREKLSYEREAGLLTRLSEVQAEVFRLARATRNRLLAIPDRVAAELAATRSERKVRQRLRDELRKALEELQGD